MNPAVGCHYFPPGLQLPSQPSGITALTPVPTYTAWWQRHIGVRNLTKVFTPCAQRRIEPMTSWSQVQCSTTAPWCSRLCRVIQQLQKQVHNSLPQACINSITMLMKMYNILLLALGTRRCTNFKKIFIIDHLFFGHQRWRLVFVKQCPQVLQVH